MTLLKGRIKVPSVLPHLTPTTCMRLSEIYCITVFEKKKWFEMCLRGSQWRKDKILYGSQAQKPHKYQNGLMVAKIVKSAGWDNIII